MIMQRYTVAYRRKRKGRTNYKKRIKLLLGNKPRFIVRKSLMSTYAQIALFDVKGDKIVASASTKELLKKYGWKHGNNISSAYLVGMMLGRKAIKSGIKEAILDTGFYSSTKGSKIYACLKGAIDAGLKIPHNPEILPTEDRLLGKHIENFVQKSKTIVSDVQNIKTKVIKE
ncbi:MAG: 50S ribosomal protein L18 [Candidatus Woesearchaeota archaeon]